MKAAYLVAPIAFVLAACSGARMTHTDFVYSPKCLEHSLTFETMKDGDLDYEFKDDPTQDTGIHIVVTPANTRYRVFHDGRIVALAPYIDPPAITKSALDAMRSTFMLHDVTFVEYAGDGTYAMSLMDNPESSKEVHVVVMPDASRFRIWNDGRIQPVSSRIQDDPEYTTAGTCPAH